jgi:hypothetical protein
MENMPLSSKKPTKKSPEHLTEEKRKVLQSVLKLLGPGLNNKVNIFIYLVEKLDMAEFAKPPLHLQISTDFRLIVKKKQEEKPEEGAKEKTKKGEAKAEKELAQVKKQKEITKFLKPIKSKVKNEQKEVVEPVYSGIHESIKEVELEDNMLSFNFNDVPVLFDSSEFFPEPQAYKIDSQYLCFFTTTEEKFSTSSISEFLKLLTAEQVYKLILHTEQGATKEDEPKEPSEESEQITLPLEESNISFKEEINENINLTNMGIPEKKKITIDEEEYQNLKKNLANLTELRDAKQRAEYYEEKYDTCSEELLITSIKLKVINADLQEDLQRSNERFQEDLQRSNKRLEESRNEYLNLAKEKNALAKKYERVIYEKRKPEDEEIPVLKQKIIDLEKLLLISQKKEEPKSKATEVDKKLESHLERGRKIKDPYLYQQQNIAAVINLPQIQKRTQSQFKKK